MISKTKCSVFCIKNRCVLTELFNVECSADGANHVGNCAVVSSRKATTDNLEEASLLHNAGPMVVLGDLIIIFVPSDSWCWSSIHKTFENHHIVFNFYR